MLAGKSLEELQKLATSNAVGTKPLSLPLVPTSLTGWFDSFNSGAAGLILLFSSVIAGTRIAWFVLPASAVALFGARLGMPKFGAFDANWTSMTIAIALAVLGLFFGREKMRSV